MKKLIDQYFASKQKVYLQELYHHTSLSMRVDNDSKFKHNVRGYISGMHQKKLIKNVGRGVWELV